MSLTSILLIVLSAGLHVFSNVAMKSARNRSAFIWWTWFWVAVLFLPVLVLSSQRIPGTVWILIGISAICDSFYYRALARAYEGGDLSIVYPLARGTAPVFILLWSTLLLKERPSTGGIVGIALIVLGVSALNLRRLSAWRDLLRSFANSSPRWALMAGLCISLYTTIDRVGVSYVSPLLYTYVTMTAMVICLTPGTVRMVGWQGLKEELKASKLNSVIAGLFAMTAYTIVLVAMHQGLPTSYAGATREISVVFGTAIGILWLKEQGSAMRVLGSVLIAAGAGSIALLG
jgi:uncharacterized membrane protein